LAFYRIQTGGNISCDGLNNVCVCYGYSITNCKVYHSMNSFVLWGAGYTARKFLYEAHLQEETSCNNNAWQSEWGCTVCVCGRTSVWTKCNPLQNVS